MARQEAAEGLAWWRAVVAERGTLNGIDDMRSTTCARSPSLRLPEPRRRTVLVILYDKILTSTSSLRLPSSHTAAAPHPPLPRHHTFHFPSRAAGDARGGAMDTLARRLGGDTARLERTEAFRCAGRPTCRPAPLFRLLCVRGDDFTWRESVPVTDRRAPAPPRVRACAAGLSAGVRLKTSTWDPLTACSGKVTLHHYCTPQLSGLIRHPNWGPHAEWRRATVCTALASRSERFLWGHGLGCTFAKALFCRRRRRASAAF